MMGTSLCHIPLFLHQGCIPLMIAASKKKNVLITVCVQRHCQPCEANIPDRVHYACDVNEECAGHISAVCHQRPRKQGGWGQAPIILFYHPQRSLLYLISEQLTFFGTRVKCFLFKLYFVRRLLLVRESFVLQI